MRRKTGWFTRLTRTLTRGKTGLDVMAFVKAARDALTSLFEEDNAHPLGCLLPKTADSDASVGTPPSQAAKTFEPKVFANLAKEELALFTRHVNRLKEEVVKLISPLNLHNNTYWSGFINSLVFELADGFTAEQSSMCPTWKGACGKSWQRHLKREREPNEAEVQAQLLEPLFKKVAHSVVCMALGEEGWTGQHYSSGLSMEVNVEQRAGRPQVDYVMSAHSAGKMIYCVPVEAKTKLELADIPQLTAYQAATAEEKWVGVGVPVDNHRDNPQDSSLLLCQPRDQDQGRRLDCSRPRIVHCSSRPRTKVGDSTLAAPE